LSGRHPRTKDDGLDSQRGAKDKSNKCHEGPKFAKENVKALVIQYVHFCDLMLIMIMLILFILMLTHMLLMVKILIIVMFMLLVRFIMCRILVFLMP
jgi:hypothetical protein